MLDFKLKSNARISPMEQNGQVVSAIVVSTDVTDRKRFEEQLRISEQQYRSVFETTRDALFALDGATGAILDANPAACELYGYTRDELLTMRNVDVSAEPVRTAAALKTDLTHAPLRFHRKKDGTVFPVEIVASYYMQGDRKLSSVPFGISPNASAPKSSCT